MITITERFESLLALSLQEEASDIHLSPERPVYIRRFGKLVSADESTWTDQNIEELIDTLLNPLQRESFESERSLDFAYNSHLGPRFRLNVYYEKQRPSLAIRRIEQSISNFENLGLPSSLEKLTSIQDGLVLVTGPTGSGKSTTLNAIIDRINRIAPQHIITIEDPIEQIHDGAQSLICQERFR